MKRRMKHKELIIANALMWMALIYGIMEEIMMPEELDRKVRVCEGRDGLQVADRVPVGKRRWRKDVIMNDGSTIPFREWVKCEMVSLPTNR